MSTDASQSQGGADAPASVNNPRSAAAAATAAANAISRTKQARARTRFFDLWAVVAAILLLAATVYLLNILSVPVAILIWTVIIVFCLRGIVNGLEKRHINRGLGTTIAYVIMALSLNLVVGISGELSLGHAGFMSVGAFSGVVVSLSLQQAIPSGPVRLAVAMLVGAVCAGIAGFIVGVPVLRLRGDYLAIVTLACGEIIKNIITNLDITGGALGLNTGAIYSNAKTLLPYAAVLVLLTVLVMMNLKHSKHGRAIMAIRDNRIAAESIGINVTYFKLAVFMLSAFFAGAAGTLYGHFFANVKAASFDYNMSIEILVIVVLGGMGSVPGSIIAAIVLQLLPELMREFADYRLLLYAIVLILVMLATNDPRMREFFERLRPSNLVRKLAAKNKKEAQTDD